MWTRLKSKVRRAAGLYRNEDGSLTVEMAVVTPFFILLIIGGFEIANFQMLQGDVQHAVHVVGRQLSVGEIQSSAASGRVDTELASWSGTATTNVTEDAANITIAVTVPISSISKFSFLDTLLGLSAQSSLTFRKE